MLSLCTLAPFALVSEQAAVFYRNSAPALIQPACRGASVPLALPQDFADARTCRPISCNVEVGVDDWIISETSV